MPPALQTVFVALFPVRAAGIIRRRRAAPDRDRKIGRLRYEWLELKLLAAFAGVDLFAILLLSLNLEVRVNGVAVLLAFGGMLILPVALYAFIRQRQFPE